MIIKLFIVSSGADPLNVCAEEETYSCRFDDGYAQKFLQHLKKDPCLCTACGDDCRNCRSEIVPDLTDMIAGRLQLPIVTDQFIDDPKNILPEELPQHTFTIAINVHSDLLVELPGLAVAAGSKALIVPVEDPDWLSPWTQRELETKCSQFGLEFAAPKPFCSLTGEGTVFIKLFTEEFRIGRPRVEFEIDSDSIKRVKVITCAPCGATYYLARLFKGQKVDVDRIADKEIADELLHLACKGLSSYPCTASTKIDPRLKDSITHEANYLMMDSVRKALYPITL